VFSKFRNTLAASGDRIPLPPTAVQYDYEAELVVVIGKKCKYVPEDKALEVVFGYCNGNDVSARDLQLRTSQWLLGKTPDRFFPTGPYLVTADEVGDPHALKMRCWVNGERRQDSHTGDMIFKVPRLVSYISQYMTLEPGDVISTGTPSGVIIGMQSKVWLKSGDEVSVEIEKLGRLTNTLQADTGG
jgi:2-keto-4-pentenoate hydratase/2-oxohepta-3-ene-1,7-dioic acid hydratase in catechol pathway